MTHGGEDRRADGWRRLGWIVAAAVIARVLVLGDPVIHVDEEFYFVTAQAMWHGALPYVDVWDRKPVGLFLLYTPAAGLPLPWGTLAYQAMALASVVATAWLVGRLADRAGWRAGATSAAVAYVLWLDPLGGVGGQAPVFFNLAMAGAAALIAYDRPGRTRGLVAMALVGVALQVKYSVVFEGVAFGLWLLWREWRERRSIAGTAAYGVALVAVALLPTAIAFATYAALGHADAFAFANFASIFARNPDPWSERLGNAGALILILSPLIAMAFGIERSPLGEDAPVRRFLLGWFAVALAGVALFGSWFDHYGLPVLVPGAACAAGFFANPRWRRLGPPILALVALIGLATVAINRANRGTARQLAALAAAVGRGPGCLYVYSGSTMLYPATGRCRPSAYIFPSHLGRARERGSIGVDQAQEVRRILGSSPAVVVMRPPYRGERPEIRAIVLAEVRRRYRLAATLPMGRERIEVWRR